MRKLTGSLLLAGGSGVRGGGVCGNGWVRTAADRIHWSGWDLESLRSAAKAETNTYACAGGKRCT
jgi:hypothetical protein